MTSKSMSKSRRRRRCPPGKIRKGKGGRCIKKCSRKRFEVRNKRTNRCRRRCSSRQYRYRGRCRVLKNKSSTSKSK